MQKVVTGYTPKARGHKEKRLTRKGFFLWNICNRLHISIVTQLDIIGGKWC